MMPPSLLLLLPPPSPPPPSPPSLSPLPLLSSLPPLPPPQKVFPSATDTPPLLPPSFPPSPLPLPPLLFFSCLPPLSPLPASLLPPPRHRLSSPDSSPPSLLTYFPPLPPSDETDPLLHAFPLPIPYPPFFLSRLSLCCASPGTNRADVSPPSRASLPPPLVRILTSFSLPRSLFHTLFSHPSRPPALPAPPHPALRARIHAHPDIALMDQITSVSGDGLATPSMCTAPRTLTPNSPEPRNDPRLSSCNCTPLATRPPVRPRLQPPPPPHHPHVLPIARNGIGRPPLTAADETGTRHFPQMAGDYPGTKDDALLDAWTPPPSNPPFPPSLAPCSPPPLRPHPSFLVLNPLSF